MENIQKKLKSRTMNEVLNNLLEIEMYCGVTSAAVAYAFEHVYCTYVLMHMQLLQK